MIRSKKNNLFNYFACNHKDLSKNYLNDCKKFFKTLSTNKGANKMSISTDQMQFNEIDEVYSKTFFYKQKYDCADVYIWSGQICLGKDFLKKVINSCNDKDIKNILSQTLDDRETYQNVIPRYDMKKVAKRESYERFLGYNKINEGSK